MKALNILLTVVVAFWKFFTSLYGLGFVFLTFGNFYSQYFSVAWFYCMFIAVALFCTAELCRAINAKKKVNPIQKDGLDFRHEEATIEYWDLRNAQLREQLKRMKGE